MDFISVGQEAEGFIAIGQHARGVIAFGQIATGVIAVGQVARGCFTLSLRSARSLSFTSGKRAGAVMSPSFAARAIVHGSFESSFITMASRNALSLSGGNVFRAAYQSRSGSSVESRSIFIVASPPPAF